MSQERPEALMFCVAENDILESLSAEDLVAKFATTADRRLDLGQTDGVHVRPAVACPCHAMYMQASVPTVCVIQ